MGSVTIGGNLVGAGTASGRIIAGNLSTPSQIASVTIGGSVIGGSGSNSGQIVSAGDLGTVKIGGDLQGASIASTQPTVDSTAYIQGASIKSIFIGGSILAGVDTSSSGDLTRNATISAVNDIGSITVLGSIVGTGSGDPSDANFTPALITARGKASHPASGDVAIGKLIVGGRVQFADIMAGYDTDAAHTGSNADAQIGKITVGGDWISSNLLAGVKIDGDGVGNSTDAKISGGGVKDGADSSGAISKIASVVIKGNAIGHSGTGAAYLTFGIEAQQLGKIIVGNATVPFLSGAGTDTMGAANAVGDAHALGTTTGSTISDGFSFHAFEIALS